jgi:glutamate--cysteine ligase
MAGAESSPLLASRTDLVDAMARGGKPRAEWRVGTEHEKHVFRRAPLRPLP